MGTGQPNATVADAGPLIHLAEINSLSLLRVFDLLHIPDAVWSETVGQGRVQEPELLGLGIVHRHPVTEAQVARFAADNGLHGLHTGETHCLCLCQQIAVPILLTDDLAVREAARQLSLTPVGSLGVVVRAYRLGFLSLVDAERRIADLNDVSTLFVTPAIVELAIAQLRTRVP